MADRPAEALPRATEDQRRALGVVLGAGVVVGLAVIDWRVGGRDNVVGTVILGPLLCALLATATDVAAVGVFATAVVVLSGTWDDNFDEATYYLRVAVVALGAVIAALASSRRQTIARDRTRFAVLAGVADVADGTLDLEETAARVNTLLVPTVADICIVDVVDHRRLRRLTVRANGARAGEIEAALCRRAPSPSADPSSSGLGPPASAQLLERVDEDALQRLAHDDDDLALLHSLRLRSRIVVPLASRGRALGALSLSVTAESGRAYGREDLHFVEVLAGRVALALDNAGLFAELETIEAQLGASMASLTEAVTIQRAEGALIYANDAAARMLGLDSPQQLLMAPVTEVIGAFDSFHEDGSPVTLADLPGRKVLAGEEAEPLVVRAVNRATGEEHWRVTKATPVRDSRGDVTLVVNVIEDITDVKRAEIAQRLLAEAGSVLASSLDYERTLQQVAELAVPGLADWCAVGLPDGRGYIRTVAVAHVDPERVAFARRVGDQYPTTVDAPTGPAQVIREQVSQMVNDITPEMLAAGAEDAEHAELLSRLNMRAALVVPMVAGGRAIGGVTLISARSAPPFTAADVALPEEVGRR